MPSMVQCAIEPDEPKCGAMAAAVNRVLIDPTAFFFIYTSRVILTEVAF
jgi:hypothetical protein